MTLRPHTLTSPPAELMSSVADSTNDPKAVEGVRAADSPGASHAAELVPIGTSAGASGRYVVVVGLDGSIRTAIDSDGVRLWYRTEPGESFEPAVAEVQRRVRAARAARGVSAPTELAPGAMADLTRRIVLALAPHTQTANDDTHHEVPMAAPPFEVVALKVNAFAKRWDYSKREIENRIVRGLPLVGEGRARRVPIAEGDAWMRAHGESPVERRARQAARKFARTPAGER